MVWEWLEKFLEELLEDYYCWKNLKKNKDKLPSKKAWILLFEVMGR